MPLDGIQILEIIECFVASPDNYYFSPDNQPILVDVLAQNEQFGDALFHYCPSMRGCRAIVNRRTISGASTISAGSGSGMITIGRKGIFFARVPAGRVVKMSFNGRHCLCYSTDAGAKDGGPLKLFDGATARHTICAYGLGEFALSVAHGLVVFVNVHGVSHRPAIPMSSQRPIVGLAPKELFLHILIGGVQNKFLNLPRNATDYCRHRCRSSNWAIQMLRIPDEAWSLKIGNKSSTNGTNGVEDGRIYPPDRLVNAITPPKLLCQVFFLLLLIGQVDAAILEASFTTTLIFGLFAGGALGIGVVWVHNQFFRRRPPQPPPAIGNNNNGNNNNGAGGGGAGGGAGGAGAHDITQYNQRRADRNAALQAARIAHEAFEAQVPDPVPDNDALAIAISSSKKIPKAEIGRDVAEIGRDVAEIGRDVAEIGRDVAEIIRFEKELQQILIPDEQRRNFSQMYNIRRLSEMERDIFPDLNWTAYFGWLMPDVMRDYVASDPEVVLAEPAFFVRLTNLLSKTDKRIIANDVLWRYASAWSFQMDERYDDIQQDFLKAFLGKQSKSPRWKDCSSSVSQRMSYASCAMYVRKHFDKKSKTAALEMFVLEPEDHYAEMVEKVSVWAQKKAFQRLVEEVDVNGIRAQSENIADNGGIKQLIRQILTDPHSPFGTGLTAWLSTSPSLLAR